jgi:hypothetical protein
VLLEEVRARAAECCPRCHRPKQSCILYLTRHESDGFAVLPEELASDPDYAPFYRRFRVALSRVFDEHLAGSANDRNLVTRCLTEALFGPDFQTKDELHAFGVEWKRVSGADGNVDGDRRIHYRIDTPARSVFVEVKNAFSSDDLAGAFLESIPRTRSDAVFYLMNVHTGLAQSDYVSYKRQFQALADASRRRWRGRIELRHVNLLPFYDNADRILEFLQTIRG